MNNLINILFSDFLKFNCSKGLIFLSMLNVSLVAITPAYSNSSQPVGGRYIYLRWWVANKSAGYVTYQRIRHLQSGKARLQLVDNSIINKPKRIVK